MADGRLTRANPVYIEWMDINLTFVIYLIFFKLGPFEQEIRLIRKKLSSLHDFKLKS